MTDQTHSRAVQTTPTVKPGNYSPVHIDIDDSLGALFLGILCVILLVGWLKAEARNRNPSGT